MRDDRLLLDYFSNTNTNPIEHQEKWWVTGAVILIAGQLAFGAAVIWFLEARPPVFRLQPAPSCNQTARAYLGISDGRAFQGSRRERPCCPPLSRAFCPSVNVQTLLTMILVPADAAERNHLPQIVLAIGGTPMTDIKSLRDKAATAERLARTVGDSLTIDRLNTLSAEYRQRADQLEITPPTALAIEPVIGRAN